MCLHVIVHIHGHDSACLEWRFCLVALVHKTVWGPLACIKCSDTEACSCWGASSGQPLAPRGAREDELRRVRSLLTDLLDESLCLGSSSLLGFRTYKREVVGPKGS